MEHLRQLQDDGGGSKGKCSNFSFLFYGRLCLAYSVLIYIYKWLGRRGGEGYGFSMILIPHT